MITLSVWIEACTAQIVAFKGHLAAEQVSYDLPSSSLSELKIEVEGVYERIYVQISLISASTRRVYVSL